MPALSIVARSGRAASYTGPMSQRGSIPRRLDVAAFADDGGELERQLAACEPRRA